MVKLVIVTIFLGAVSIRAPLADVLGDRWIVEEDARGEVTASNLSLSPEPLDREQLDRMLERFHQSNVCVDAAFREETLFVRGAVRDCARLARALAAFASEPRIISMVVDVACDCAPDEACCG